MSAETTVRPARPEEIDGLIAIGRLLYRESAMAFLPFSEEKMRRLADYYFARPETHCVLIAEQAGEIIGLFAGYITQYLFNSERLAMNTFIYMRPDKRGFASVKLIRAFEGWARDRGVRKIGVGMSAGIKVDRSARLFERLGYAAVGYTLKKRVA